jgi:serine protease inhibitor
MQTKWRWYFAHFYLSISLSLAAQAQRSGSPPSPIVDANNRFAFKLFAQLTGKAPDHNIVVAPTGLSLTFGLLANGCDSEARKEIDSAFEFAGMDLTQINGGFAALKTEMNLQVAPAEIHRPTAPTLRDPNGTIIADSIWIKRGYFTAQFLQMSRDNYGVDLNKWLSSPSPFAQISRWVSKRTNLNIRFSDRNQPS